MLQQAVRQSGEKEIFGHVLKLAPMHLRRPSPSDLPFHRKLANGTHLYRVHSLERFTELQRVGKRWVVHEVRARSYPELLLIVSLFHGDDERYLPIEASEFEEVLRLAGPDGAEGG